MNALTATPDEPRGPWPPRVGDSVYIHAGNRRGRLIVVSPPRLSGKLTVAPGLSIDDWSRYGMFDAHLDEVTPWGYLRIQGYAEPVHGAQLKPQDGDRPRLLRTHDESLCRDDETCCVHAPSDHHMRDWPMNWRADRGLMERVCPDHGTGHPDPDDIAHKVRVMGEANGRAEAVHGCCGCCARPLADEPEPRPGKRIREGEAVINPGAMRDIAQNAAKLLAERLTADRPEPESAGAPELAWILLSEDRNGRVELEFDADPIATSHEALRSALDELASDSPAHEVRSAQVDLRALWDGGIRVWPDSSRDPAALALADRLEDEGFPEAADAVRRGL